MDRGDRSSEDMVVSVKNPESFDGEHIEVVFHDTKSVFFPSFIRTDSADGFISISEPETYLAIVHIGLEFLEFPSEVLHIGTIRFQQKKREFHRGFFADSRHIGNEVDETLKSFWHGIIWELGTFLKR